MSATSAKAGRPMQSGQYFVGCGFIPLCPNKQGYFSTRTAPRLGCFQEENTYRGFPFDYRRLEIDKWKRRTPVSLPKTSKSNLRSCNASRDLGSGRSGLICFGCARVESHSYAPDLSREKRGFKVRSPCYLTRLPPHSPCVFTIVNALTTGRGGACQTFSSLPVPRARFC